MFIHVFVNNFNFSHEASITGLETVDEWLITQYDIAAIMFNDVPELLAASHGLHQQMEFVQLKRVKVKYL